MATKKSDPSKNPIRHRGSFSFSSAHSLLDSVRFCDEKAKDDFFNRAIHSECQVTLSNFLDTPLLDAFSSRGWASLCEISKRCLGVYIQEFYSNMHTIDTSVLRFTIVFQGTRIVVTPKFIFNVLHAPEVDHPDYPSHCRLSSVSRDEMASLFCEKAMVWGETLNFSATEFAKGPWILNMVMTFVLIPRSHYNTITEPCV